MWQQTLGAARPLTVLILSIAVIGCASGPTEPSDDGGSEPASISGGEVSDLATAVVELTSENILNRSFTDIGIGYTVRDRRPYYVQLFGRPR